MCVQVFRILLLQGPNVETLTLAHPLIKVQPVPVDPTDHSWWRLDCGETQRLADMSETVDGFPKLGVRFWRSSYNELGSILGTPSLVKVPVVCILYFLGGYFTVVIYSILLRFMLLLHASGSCVLVCTYRGMHIKSTRAIHVPYVVPMNFSLGQRQQNSPDRDPGHRSFNYICKLKQMPQQ